MKNFFRSIAIIYFAIGSLLSFPMAISYIYAQWFVVIDMGWSIFSFAGLGLIMFTGYLIVITPMIRAIFWLPSLVMWLIEPGGYSFLRWIAPGFYTAIG